MNERVVLVTGGSRGIGAEIVRLLARRAVRVGCGYLNSHSAAAQLQAEFPGLVEPVHYELGSAESAEAAVSHVTETWGQLDGLVANAGIWSGGKLTVMSDADWNRVVRTNIEGVAQQCRAALPAVIASGRGSITIVSSVVGIVGGPGDTAYASAKSGLIGLGRALAKEVARERVRVNVLAPGFVETDMTAEVPETSRAEIARSIPLRRFGSATEIAAAAVFLSEDATYNTGSVLTVDGGWSL